MAALTGLCRKNLLTTIFGRNGRVLYRPISTSGKKKEASEPCPSVDTVYKKVPDFSKPLENENWVSYGADYGDKYNDRFMMHLILFCAITLGFCGSVFVNMFFPDRGRRDWARREAFIKLYEREQLGLTPIDPNYVDPETVVLPEDDEIGENEIII